MTARKRFYREVSVSTRNEGEHQVLLDGKPLRTPSGEALVLPNAALAEAIAAEWRGQGDTFRPDAMVLTKLANTAIDQIAAKRDAAIDQVLGFANSELLCYRAPSPDALARRQAEAWDPILAWAQARYGAVLLVTVGIGHIAQSPGALAALRGALAAHDDFAIAGIQSASALLSSCLLALALSDRHLDAGEAFAAAHLDEIYQSEKWGRDHEAERVLAAKLAELKEIARFLQLVRE